MSARSGTGPPVLCGDHMSDNRAIDANSMLIWWPKVEDLGIPVPRTVIVEEPAPGFLTALGWAVQGEQSMPSGWETFRTQIEDAADEVGYPAFMRTDLFSGKHEWERTCFVPDRSKVWQHLGGILEFGELCSFLGFDHTAVVLREFLRLDVGFGTAYGLPVAAERRYFVRDGRVECHHAYWVEAAVEGRMEILTAKDDAEPCEWRSLLAKLNLETHGEIEILSEYAGRVGRVLPGYWSVDFARTADQRWWLIDMAQGDASWHPEGCSYSPEGGRQ